MHLEIAIEKTFILPLHFRLSIGMEFSYHEAPSSLKTVILSFWLLCVSLGNLITLVFVSSVHIFEYQSHEFLFFAGMMFVDMLIFGILAYFYKSTNHPENEQLA